MDNITTLSPAMPKPLGKATSLIGWAILRPIQLLSPGGLLLPTRLPMANSVPPPPPPSQPSFPLGVFPSSLQQLFN